MKPHRIDLRREFEKETGIEIFTITGSDARKYTKWLEDRLQTIVQQRVQAIKTSHNRKRCTTLDRFNYKGDYYVK